MKKNYFMVIFALLLVFASIFANTVASANNNDVKFYMGFTPWPPDLSISAISRVYKFINNNSTIISHHFDGGVPWYEAYYDKAFPNDLLKNWEMRKTYTSSKLKVFLSLTPLNFTRDGLALAWTEKGENQKLPKYWQNKRLNDPDVKKAYSNYVLRAVAYFKPEFLATGIESNILISKKPELWEDYLELNEYVYKKVKEKYPNLIVFNTIQYEHLRGIEADAKKNQYLQKPLVKILMKHSDVMALSTYNYGYLHPNPPSNDYFNAAIEFKKPIAIAEMGAMSKTTIVAGIPLTASEATQLNFLKIILEAANKYRFLFVINWVAIDFDEMLPKLPSQARELAKAWVHSGMLDSNMKAKKALMIWQEYLKKQQD